MKVSEKYHSVKFHFLLFTEIQEFIGEHMNADLISENVNYLTYGSPKQVKLKLLVQLTGRISNVLADLDITFMFLNKDRKLINEHYPDLESQEEYYKYHLENFYIRLTTLLDIIGKLGNEVYDLGIKKDKISAYSFKDKAKSRGFEKIAQITGDLIEKIDEYRKARHSKLHTGESDFNLFRKIIIWEDLMKLIDSKVDPLLIENTNEEIKIKLESLKNFTGEVIQLIENFLDEASTKLEKYLFEEDI